MNGINFLYAVKFAFYFMGQAGDWPIRMVPLCVYVNKLDCELFVVCCFCRSFLVFLLYSFSHARFNSKWNMPLRVEIWRLLRIYIFSFVTALDSCIRFLACVPPFGVKMCLIDRCLGHPILFVSVARNGKSFHLSVQSCFHSLSTWHIKMQNAAQRMRFFSSFASSSCEPKSAMLISINQCHNLDSFLVMNFGWFLIVFSFIPCQFWMGSYFWEFQNEIKKKQNKTEINLFGGFNFLLVNHKLYKIKFHPCN